MLGFICVLKNALPIGALTSKPYTFGSRPWELKSYEIFDPTSGFYQPITVNVMNNMIQRVLPFNPSGLVHYNWIPNRLRFFFESFFVPRVTEDEFPKVPISVLRLSKSASRSYKYEMGTKLTSRSWIASIKKLVTKFVGLRFNISGFLDLCSHNLDLYSELEFNALNSEFVCLFKYPVSLQDSGVDSGIFFRRSKTLQFAEMVSRVYFRIFLVLFNLYFSDPNLIQYLCDSVSDKSLVVYTFMYGYFRFKLKYLCANLTVENLSRLFSGKHLWSSHLFKSSSLIIIDVVFILGLPRSLLTMVLKFINQHPENVYLVNSGYPNTLYTSISSNFLTRVNLRTHLIFGGSDFFLDQYTLPAVSDAIHKLFPGERTYPYLFDYDVVQFSQYNNFSLNYPIRSKFWFSLFLFVLFFARYVVGGSKIYQLGRVMNSKQRSIGSFLCMLHVYFKISRKYSYFCLNFCSVVFFVFLVIYHLVTNGISGILLNNSVFGYEYSLGNWINYSRWYGFEKRYFASLSAVYNILHVNDVCLPRTLKSFWAYPNYRSNSDIVFPNDNFVNCSKTLVLDREFRISRFNNFVGNCSMLI